MMNCPHHVGAATCTRCSLLASILTGLMVSLGWWTGPAFAASGLPVIATVAASRAQLTTPAPGSTLTSSTVTFGWTAGSGVSQISLYVGTGGAGTYDIYYGSQGTSLSRTVSGLPNDGSTIYLRLWSTIEGTWQYDDYTYTASAITGTETRLTTPPPGSTLTSSTVTFEWTAASGVSEIVLYVGTGGAGGYDIYYASQGTSLSRTLSGLPNDGTIYVRLWSRLGGTWQYSDYTYKGGSDAWTAQLTTPASGSTLTSSTVTFGWTASSAVSQVALYVGTFGAGTYDVYHAFQGTSLSRTVAGLPTDGRTVYVRLWSYLDGGWQYHDYTYTALTDRAQLTTPAPGSVLNASSVTFGWTEGSGVSQVALYVGTDGAGSYDIYHAFQGTNLSSTVSGLPTNGGTIYVRLWSYVVGAWQYDDYTYPVATGRAQLTTPAPGSTLTSSSVTFEWTAGSGVSQVALYVGTGGVGSYDIYYAFQGTSLSNTVSGLPTDGRSVYVRLWSYLGGAWQYDDYTYRATTGRAQLTTPAPGSTLTSSTVTFEWTAGSGVSQIVLYVGTGGAGSYDVYFASQGAGLSRTVSGLPADGSTVYVRLWSYLGGGWQYEDSTYTATR
jgi:serine protease